MNKKSMMFIVGAMCFGTFLFGAVASTMLNAQSESPSTPPTFTPPTFSFQKNLKFGDNSQDVRQLQILLNNDADTRISGSSVGSKGQESTYFGQLTANAVARFQTKYEISPTSFVGVLTRAKLNQIVSAAVAAMSAVPPTVNGVTSNPLSATSSPTIGTTSSFFGALPLSKEQLPRLYMVQPRQIKTGGTFTLVGVGFQTENTIHIGDQTFSRVFPQDGSNISFTIPATSALQNGTYEVWVENSKGTSRVTGRPINLVIVDDPQLAPVISSVLPATISGMDKVTVTGTGFTPTDNDIVSGFGTIKNLSSDGTKISFSPKDLLSTEAVARIPTGSSIKIDFYVINANGPSNILGSVDLKI